MSQSAVFVWSRGWILLGLIACASSGRAPTLDAGAQSAPSQVQCAAPEHAGGTCVLRVEGTVVDEAGIPVRDLHASVCSASLCIPAPVDDAGHFVADLARFIDPSDFVVHVDGRPAHADSLVRLPNVVSSEVVQLGALRSRTLTKGRDVLRGSGKQVLRASNVMLTLPEEASVLFAPADSEELNRTFAVGQSTVDGALEVAFGPFGTAFTAPGRVTLSLGPQSAGGRYEAFILEEDVSSKRAGTSSRLGIFNANPDGDLVVPVSKLTILTLVPKT